ncbi:calcium/sodium antiporter [Aurantiacibacter gangjinensis]|uniref:Sodium:calcium antiporter n=1 Tax=Aurantiacibacter gangjinensis TaxID=502682 RepID=A0A0G9MNX8_9SPHN|nr:calcium/sodium antiporter [Aurantiacibacter gangjinensis]APE28041.1 Inner membrane protein YrbG, predicted calcium/sodium:proton antiporter [Aurantiacibacter gangjinensis]KLE32294.1 sodium:calcium antiporter [Aurantiacibacter gangjinensis]
MSVAVLILAGLALLALGGELLVRGAVGIAEKLGVSPLLAGLTIVGFGTSMPELATSIQAAFAGSSDIAVGNVVGSNIANIILILGVTAVILPLAANRAAFKRDGIALAASSLAALACVLAGGIGRIAGIALIAALIGYILWAYLSERQSGDAAAQMHEALATDAVAAPATPLSKGTPALAVMTIAGIAAAIYGAGLLVEGAIALAQGWGVSEAVIGLTIVAVGTSLPELVACVVAALRGHGDVALGNVVGSNIYNVFGILGITALVQPLAVPQQIAALDIWVLLGVTALLLLFLRTGWTLKRWEGAVFLALYAGYTALLFLAPAAA